MTAIPLFDALVRQDIEGALPDPDRPYRLAQLAEKLVDSVLADLDRIGEYERQFGSPDVYGDSAVEVLQSIYKLYEDWEGEAEQVLTRARQVSGRGKHIDRLGQLEDACGRVYARLGITPEKMARSIEQLRTGRVVSAETIRNELRARLHR